MCIGVVCFQNVCVTIDSHKWLHPTTNANKSCRYRYVDRGVASSLLESPSCLGSELMYTYWAAGDPLKWWVTRGSTTRHTFKTWSKKSWSASSDEPARSGMQYILSTWNIMMLLCGFFTYTFWDMNGGQAHMGFSHVHPGVASIHVCKEPSC